MGEPDTPTTIRAAVSGDAAALAAAVRDRRDRSHR
jgi:hypothetical protein